MRPRTVQAFPSGADEDSSGLLRRTAVFAAVRERRGSHTPGRAAEREIEDDEAAMNTQERAGTRLSGFVGYLLNATYATAGADGRAVVHLYGKLQDGRPFLVRDGRAVPYFYVEHSDRLRAHASGARLVPTELRTLHGARVCRVDLAHPQEGSRRCGSGCTAPACPRTRRTSASPIASSSIEASAAPCASTAIPLPWADGSPGPSCSTSRGCSPPTGPRS